MRFSGSQFLQILRIVLGSISAVSQVRSLILPEERLFQGMSVGSFSRTAAGNRAYDCSPATKITIPNKFTPIRKKELHFLTVSINIGDFFNENLLKGFMIHFFQKTSICYLAFPDSNSGMKIHVSTQLVRCGSSSN